MAVDIILDGAINRDMAVRLGPFAQVRLTHRRMRAGDLEIVRHFDGGWHWNGASFLEAGIQPAMATERLIKVDFARPWARPTRGESAEAVRLYGDRLYLQPAHSWVATDDDEGRCWVAESTGLANEEVVVAAA
jgi:hypothetical protein